MQAYCVPCVLSRLVTKCFGAHVLRSSVGIRNITKTSQSEQDAEKNPFDEHFLELFACPLTKEPLRYDKQAQELVNDVNGIAYPIKSGIPHISPTEGYLKNDPADGSLS